MKKTQEGHRALKIVAICCAAFALQGCVAAAFPLVAGGLMAGGGRIEPTTDMADLETPSPENIADKAVANVEPETPVAEVVELAETTPIAPAVGNNAEAIEVVSQDENAPTDAETVAVQELAQTDVVETPMTSASAVSIAAPEPEATAPAEVANAAATNPVPIAETSSAVSAAPVQSSVDRTPALSASQAVAGVTLFDPLYNYAASPDFAGEGERQSAMLANATALEAARIKCKSGTPTVLIDLDPKDAELFPVDAGTASPAFAERLTQLRNQGVSIAWISQSGTDKESLLRVALFRSGLDQLGADRILLIAGPDQRKQLLREHLAETSCLVAIAGDERSDFHELFDYLLNPADAVALEPLIGDGWFIIPTPLLAQGSQ